MEYTDPLHNLTQQPTREMLEDEIKRRERVLREALNGDDSGDFDAVVACVKAVDQVRAELDAENERLRSALEGLVYKLTSRSVVDAMGDDFREALQRGWDALAGKAT